MKGLELTKKTVVAIAVGAVAIIIIVFGAFMNNKSQSSIIGRWLGAWDASDKQSIFNFHFIFHEDGSFNYAFEVQPQDGGDREKSEYKGTYEVGKGGKVTLTYPDGWPEPYSEYCNLNKASNEMTCSNWPDFVFTKE